MVTSLTATSAFIASVYMEYAAVKNFVKHEVVMYTSSQAKKKKNLLSPTAMMSKLLLNNCQVCKSDVLLLFLAYRPPQSPKIMGMRNTVR